MPKGQASGVTRVYIWYPDEDEYGSEHVGHVSMYFGNYEVGAGIELSLDPHSPNGVMSSAFDRTLDLSGIHYNDNYVS